MAEDHHSEALNNSHSIGEARLYFIACFTSQLQLPPEDHDPVKMVVSSGLTLHCMWWPFFYGLIYISYFIYLSVPTCRRKFRVRFLIYSTFLFLLSSIAESARTFINTIRLKSVSYGSAAEPCLIKLQEKYPWGEGNTSVTMVCLGSHSTTSY